MKILKYLLYVLLVLVLIGVILGLVGPKTKDIHRTRFISATPEQIWPYVSNWEKINLWSPWVRMDTSLTLEYSGNQGTIGSKYSWSSKKMGSGEQTITALAPNQSMDAELIIKMFGESTSQTSIMLKDTAGGTNVSWAMHGKNSFAERIMSSLMSMDKMIGKEYEKGLNSLDSLMATLPKPSPGMKIYTEEYPGGKYLGIKSKVKISELKDFFAKSFTPVMEGVKKTNAEVAGMPSGLYYTWEVDKNMTEVAAAVAIKNEVKAPMGLQLFVIPPGKMAVMDYMGGYGGLGNAHNAIAEYFRSNSMEQSPPVIEEYITDPMMEKDSTKWHTRIIYFVK